MDWIHFNKFWKLTYSHTVLKKKGEVDMRMVPTSGSSCSSHLRMQDGLPHATSCWSKCVSAVYLSNTNVWTLEEKSVMSQVDRSGAVNSLTRVDKKSSSSDINNAQTWGWQLHWYPVEGLSTVLPPDPPPPPWSCSLVMTMTLKAKALSSALFTPEHLGRKKLQSLLWWDESMWKEMRKGKR